MIARAILVKIPVDKSIYQHLKDYELKCFIFGKKLSVINVLLYVRKLSASIYKHTQIYIIYRYMFMRDFSSFNIMLFHLKLQTCK